MSGQDKSREGGCLCGAVRYRIQGAPNWVAHCHCNSCRRACGSVVMTWAGYPAENYRITRGSPRRHESSSSRGPSRTVAAKTPAARWGQKAQRITDLGYVEACPTANG